MPYSEALRAVSLEAIGMVVSESNDYRLATHLDGSENDGLRWLSALNGGGHGEHWTSADGERLGRRERRKNEQSRSAHRRCPGRKVTEVGDGDLPGSAVVVSRLGVLLFPIRGGQPHHASRASCIVHLAHHASRASCISRIMHHASRISWIYMYSSHITNLSCALS